MARHVTSNFYVALGPKRLHGPDLENAYNQVFFKIFSTYDKDAISHCQSYMGYLPIRLTLDIRKLTFLTRFMSADNHSIINGIHDEEYVLLCNKYDIPRNGKLINFKYFVWKHFKNIIPIN